MSFLLAINALAFGVVAYGQAMLAWSAADSNKPDDFLSIDGDPSSDASKRAVMTIGAMAGLYALLALINASFAVQIAISS